MAKARDVVHLKFKGNYKTDLLRTDIVGNKHPVLVLETLPNDKLRICTISHKMDQTDLNKTHNPPRPYNVALYDWKQAGLDYASYVDVSTNGIIDASNVFKVIGSISIKDYVNVLNQFKISSQRNLLEYYKIYNTGAPEYLDYYINDNGNTEYLI